MGLLFNDFISWKSHCIEKQVLLYQPVIEYEIEQKGRSEEEIWEGLSRAYQVMKEAVRTGLEDEMSTKSGMIENAGKKVYQHFTSTTACAALSPKAMPAMYEISAMNEG